MEQKLMITAKQIVVVVAIVAFFVVWVVEIVELIIKLARWLIRVRNKKRETITKQDESANQETTNQPYKGDNGT